MDCSMPSFPVHHQPPELAQTHVIELVMPSNHLILCHPLLILPSIFPSIRVFYQWVGSLHQVAKVWELQLQHQSFQWIFRTDFFQNWLDWSLCSPRDSQESSPTPKFKNINSLALSFLYGPILTSIHDYWNNIVDYEQYCWQRNSLLFETTSFNDSQFTGKVTEKKLMHYPLKNHSSDTGFF